jgi:hypothetical protein
MNNSYQYVQPSPKYKKVNLPYGEQTLRAQNILSKKRLQ